MARYIDADKLLGKAEEIEWWNEGTGFYDNINIVHRYDVETAPTEDVVPRSDIVKEIFEEIGKLTFRYLSDANYSGGEFVYDIDSLKWKYMKGE